MGLVDFDVQLLNKLLIVLLSAMSNEIIISNFSCLCRLFQNFTRTVSFSGGSYYISYLLLWCLDDVNIFYLLLMA